MNQKHASGDQIRKGASSAESSHSSRADMGHMTSSEVLRLTEELNRIPDTRERLIAQAVTRYESGYYLTQEAADQAADRLIGKAS